MLQGIADTGVVETTRKAKSQRQCVLQCASVLQCKSLNYRQTQGQCELLGRTLRESIPFLQKQSDSIYLTTDDLALNQGPKCEELSPCENGAACEDTCNDLGYKCTCQPSYYGTHCDKTLNDCSAVKDSGKTSNGLYKIKYNHENFMDVFCNLNLTSNGWIVIQRRVDASVDFYRNWASYKAGFGDVTGNFWIGLDNLHKLAGPGRGAILRVDIKHRNSPTSQYYATYSAFEIGDESSKYKLLIHGYSGTASDSMAYQNGMKFCTYDNDNDLGASENCAAHWKGAWWYNLCHHSNLNGLYPSASTTSPAFMSWFHLHSSFGDVIYSEMKIQYHR